MLSQKLLNKRYLLAILVVLISIFLIVSCAQPPPDEPAAPAVEEAEVEEAEVEGAMVDYTDTWHLHPMIKTRSV